MNSLPPLLYEVINSILWTLGASALVIFLRYLYINFRSYLDAVRPVPEGSRLRALALVRLWPLRGFATFSFRLRDQAAISIAVMLFGEVITRGWTWCARYLMDTSGYVNNWSWEMPWILVPILGSAVEAAGILCMIRVFTPDSWGSRGWIVCVSFSFLFTLFFLLYR